MDDVKLQELYTKAEAKAEKSRIFLSRMFQLRQISRAGLIPAPKRNIVGYITHKRQCPNDGTSLIRSRWGLLYSRYYRCPKCEYEYVSDFENFLF